LAFGVSPMRRRDFITLVGGGAAAWPLLAGAQQSRKPPIIGVLWHAGSAEEEAIYIGALRRGLSDLGYMDGRNIVIENRFPAEIPERFLVLAEELVALNPDVLVAVTPEAVTAAQRATKTIPTVFIIYNDPVGTKLVTSMARPGGNITGLTVYAGDLTAKRIELLAEGLGKLSRMALLAPPSNQVVITRCREVAKDLNIALEVFEVATPTEIDAAFSRVTEAKPDALYVPPSGLTYVERTRVATLALRNRLPTMFGIREYVDAGGLFSYGPSFTGEFYRAAKYIDKILKGEKAGDIPIEQPVKFELAVNLRTSKAIGVAIPPTFLLRADEVIE
jgi:ABC-type uncharacterized transport system substrate-binding protein